MKKKYYYFTLLLTLFSLLPEVKAQDCIGYIAKPATFTSATVFATVGDMSQILDGEGATGNIADGAGSNPHFYWMTGQNPVTFYIQMNTPSVVNMVKFYGPWGFDEGLKDVTVRLYSGGTLLGTENFVLPSLYSTYHFFDFSTTYTNVTNVQLVAENDYGISTVLRTSLTEVVFGESITNTPPPVKNLTNICPAVTVDLNNAHIGSIPSDKSLVWYTDDQKAGAPLAGAAITQAGAGTYYAFYYDSVNNCYSPVSDAVIVNIINTLDSDGDGIPDYCDWDDDNDGILDADESPECYYNVYEANRIQSVVSFFDGTTGFPSAGNDLEVLRNEIEEPNGTTCFRFGASQTVAPGDPIFTVEYPVEIVLSSISVVKSVQGFTTASGYGKLYGSNDGITYDLLTSGNGVSLTTEGTLTFSNSNTTAYKYYQIRFIGSTAAGNSTSRTINATPYFREITSIVSSAVPYIPSAHPKPGPCTADTDGDGIPNHLDLDSDGDGCWDAYEAGATTNIGTSTIAGPYGTNGVANSLETVVDSGILNYVSTYNKYAVDENQKLCIDTDGDGIPDPIDIDDDNDGVLDIDEGDFCGKLDRNIRVGYLDIGAGSSGLAINFLYNLRNFGLHGTFNKVRGVTLIPYNSLGAVTEANLLADNIDVFFVGSTATNNDNATGSSTTDKVPQSVNNILANWAKTHNKGIFALQNNAIDYAYRTKNNNTNPNVPYGNVGNETYTNGYWPTSTLNQSGSVQLTIASQSRTFDILMVDGNLRPVVVADREYNLVIFPDATIYNDNADMVTPNNANRSAIADTWAFVFEKFLKTQCTYLDTDGDGVPNHLDLDSDGDGCSDALEAGATDDPTPNFSFTSTDSNGDGLVDILDADLNGIPDYFSFYISDALDNTVNKCRDSDGDGIPDYLDLDDDNDGILDTDEGLSCNSLNRNLRIGYLNNTLGTNGLMMNMLNNPVNFGSSGVYDKFPGIDFVPYDTQDAITEANLLADKIDIFYVGSTAADSQSSSDKLLTPTNTRIFEWASNNDKGVFVLQNNATDFGYILSNAYPNSNPSTPYGSTGESIFTNGYWPESSFDMSGVVQMSINSSERNYIAIMADVQGKATFIRDRDTRVVFIPDATIFIANQSVSDVNNATLRVAADLWAYAFDTFLQGKCETQDTDGDGIPDHLDLDSDNDGCLDAIEGGGNFQESDLVIAGGVLSVGVGSSASNKNLCADGSCVDANGVPLVAGATGQGVGNSNNSNVNDCPLPNVCTSGDCNENAFLFTSDPNTLEYDNLISGFHSTIAKQQDGNYLIWGQGAKPNTFGEHLYEPTVISPENGFNYTGEILKATLGTRGATNDGSDQYAILTTDGLYIWGGGDPFSGRKDGMVHRTVKDSQTFDKMTNANIPNADPATGLPVGVAPTDVKMLFGSYATLGVVTCTGEAYVLSHAGNKNGDGSTDGASEYNKWHRVSVGPGQPLNRIVAMRGAPGAMVALTYEGDLYTWGTDTYLADGTAKANRLYATKMTLPIGVMPKMIGMTKASDGTAGVTLNSYYLLSTTGELYSLGDNSEKQLGTFDNTERTSWVNVKSTNASTNMTDIVWISPNEHDAKGYATVTALTSDGKLWGWGMNHSNMLGAGGNVAVDPRYMFGGLDHEEKVLAIETGGHINTLFKDCDFKLGYIGHNSNGSYATNPGSSGSTSDVFKFDGARLTNLCAIYTPPFPEVSNMRVCYGETADLTDAMLNSAPAGYTLEWWTTINRISGTEVADPTSVEPGTYYAFFARDVDDCPLLEGIEVNVVQNPTTVLQQDVPDVTISANNDYSYTVGTVSYPDPLPSGYSVQYTWEYATADNPTVWNVLDNTTFPGEITLTGSTFSISHATKDIDGIKVRVTAQTVYESPLSPEVIGPVDCTTQSNEFLITIKAGAVVTNPMLLNRAK